MQDGAALRHACRFAVSGKRGPAAAVGGHGGEARWRKLSSSTRGRSLFREERRESGSDPFQAFLRAARRRSARSERRRVAKASSGFLATKVFPTAPDLIVPLRANRIGLPQIAGSRKFCQTQREAILRCCSAVRRSITIPAAGPGRATRRCEGSTRRAWRRKAMSKTMCRARGRLSVCLVRSTGCQPHPGPAVPHAHGATGVDPRPRAGSGHGRMRWGAGLMVHARRAPGRIGAGRNSWLQACVPAVPGFNAEAGTESHRWFARASPAAHPFPKLRRRRVRLRVSPRPGSPSEPRPFAGAAPAPQDGVLSQGVDRGRGCRHGRSAFRSLAPKRSQPRGRGRR